MTEQETKVDTHTDVITSMNTELNSTRSCLLVLWDYIVLILLRLVSIVFFCVVIKIENKTKANLTITQRSQIARGYYGAGHEGYDRKKFILHPFQTRYYLQNFSIAVLIIDRKELKNAPEINGINVWTWGVFKYCKITINSAQNLNSDNNSIVAYNAFVEGRKRGDNFRWNKGRKGFEQFETNKSSLPNKISSYPLEENEEEDNHWFLSLFETFIDLINEISPLITAFTDEDELNIHNKIVLCLVSLITMILDQIKRDLVTIYTQNSEESPLFYNNKIFDLLYYFLPAFLSSITTLVFRGYADTGFDLFYNYIRIGYCTIFVLLIWFRLVMILEYVLKISSEPDPDSKHPISIKNVCLLWFVRIIIRIFLFAVFAALFVAGLWYGYYSDSYELISIIAGYVLVFGIYITFVLEPNKMLNGWYNIYIVQGITYLFGLLLFVSWESVRNTLGNIFVKHKFEWFIFSIVVASIISNIYIAVRFC